MKKKSSNKLFVVRKYIWATDAGSAIRKEKTEKVCDVWIDEEYKKQPPPTGFIGFYQDAKK